MKVAVLIDRMNVGGVEKAAILQTIALTELGHDASLWVLSSDGVIPNAFRELTDKININFLDHNLRQPLRTSFRIPGFSFLSLFHFTYPFLIPSRLDDSTADLLISHNTYTTLSGIRIARRLGVPLNYYLHDPASYITSYVNGSKQPRILWKLLEVVALELDRYLIKKSAKTFLPGMLHQRFVGNLAKACGRPIAIIPWGVNSSDSLPDKRDDYVVSVTSWKRHKGLEHLFTLAERFPQLKIVVAGAWPDKDYLEEVKSEILLRHIDAQIIITGHISEEELNSLYRFARAAIIVNAERGFGLSLIEAAAHGCPVIAPFECGASHLFENGVSAVFYPYGNMERLLQSVQLMMSDETKAHAIGARAWKVVKEDLSWKQHAQSLLAEAISRS